MWCSFPAMLVNRYMKCFWVFLLCIVSSLTAAGQQADSMFLTRILLKHKPYTLQSLTKEMQAQSGISFSYNAARINPGTRIRIRGDRATVAQILAVIKRKTGISYKVVNRRHIIYVASNIKKKAAAKPGKIKRSQIQSEQQTTKQVEAAPLSEAASDNQTNNGAATTDSTKTAGTGGSGDSTLMMSYYAGGGSGSGGGGGGSDETNGDDNAPPHISERKWRRSTASSNGTSENSVLGFFGDNLLLAGGASVDETYYLNPTLKFGMRFLYGIASYNLGGGGNTWRYGLGGSASIDEHWSMHFVVTTGQSVYKDYTITYPDTTIPQAPLRVTSKLTRYGISTHYNFGNGFTVEGGLTFNSLKSNYTSNGNPVTLSNILPVGYDADEKYTGIKAPYTLGNSYSGNSTGNTKSWIGFQVTLLYQLRFSRE